MENGAIHLPTPWPNASCPNTKTHEDEVNVAIMEARTQKAGCKHKEEGHVPIGGHTQGKTGADSSLPLNSHILPCTKVLPLSAC